METSHVKMSIEEYNKMLLKVSLLERAITIEKLGNDQVVVCFEPAAVEELVTEMFVKSGLSAEYKLAPVNEWMHTSSIIGDVKLQVEVRDDS